MKNSKHIAKLIKDIKFDADLLGRTVEDLEELSIKKLEELATLFSRHAYFLMS